MQVLFGETLRATYVQAELNYAEITINECKTEPMFEGAIIRVRMPERQNPTDPFLSPVLFLNAMARLCVLVEPILDVHGRLEETILLRASFQPDDLKLFPLYDKSGKRWIVDFQIPVGGDKIIAETWGPNAEGANDWAAVVGNALAWPSIVMTLLMGESKEALAEYIMSEMSRVEADLYHPLMSPLFDRLPDEVKEYTIGYEEVLTKAKEKDAHP